MNLPISTFGGAAAAGQPMANPATSTTGEAAGFGDLFRSASQQMQHLDQSAQSAVMGLLSGSGVEVHEAMIATQKADLAFQLALQVRNKAVAAYQQMMQMQF